jgi:hypothetical protein
MAKLSQELADFFHKLVDSVGASSLHAVIDELARDEVQTAESDAQTVIERADSVATQNVTPVPDNSGEEAPTNA